MTRLAFGLYLCNPSRPFSLICLPQGAILTSIIYERRCVMAGIERGRAMVEGYDQNDHWGLAFAVRTTFDIEENLI